MRYEQSSAFVLIKDMLLVIKTKVFVKIVLRTNADRNGKGKKVV